MIGYNDSVYLEKDESLGIVVPTHFWSLPTFVEGFLSKINIISEDKNPYIFLIATLEQVQGTAADILLS